MTKKEYDKEQEQLLERQLAKLDYLDDKVYDRKIKEAILEK